LLSDSAYILVFHGSHDPRSQQAAQQLTESFRQKIGQTAQVSHAVGESFDWSNPSASNLSVITQPHPIPVQDVYLECVPQPLPQQIEQFIEQTQAAGHPIAEYVVVPVFLLAGMHVTQDLPEAIATIGTTVPLRITPHLGSCSGLRRILNERTSLLPMEAWMLLAHGSRRREANQIIENLADHLGVVAAYWATEPNLEQRLHELTTLGLKRIGILPYFLFSGSITDAIAERVSQLTTSFPQLQLTLAQPFDVNIPELADLVLDLATSN